jgi:hypothetical protein
VFKSLNVFVRDLIQPLGTKPELIDPIDVRERIQGLRDGSRQTASVVPDPFVVFLVGAGEEGSAVSVCSPGTSIGTHAESFDELASIFETLPPAFRIARGWLIGGAVAHANQPTPPSHLWATSLNAVEARWNKFGTAPPVVVDREGNFYGYFTANRNHPKRTTIRFFLVFLDNADEVTADLNEARDLFCEE